MLKAIRHGDLCLVKIEKLPEGLTPSTTKTLMQGVNKNNHNMQGGTVYLTEIDQFAFGYLVAGDNCTLLHPDHGIEKGNLVPGRGINELDWTRVSPVDPGIYELRRQFEHQHESMTQVID